LAPRNFTNGFAMKLITGLFLGAAFLFLILRPGVIAQDAKNPAPSAAVIADMLSKEPVTLDTWPTWRTRLLEWMPDRTRNPDAAFDAARALAKSQADEQDNLSPALANDPLASYLLASYYLYDKSKQFDPIQSGARAEKILRKSLSLDPNFARTHRNLALAILFQAPPGNANPRSQEVDDEIREAARLDPDLPLNREKGQIALVNQQYAEAEQFFRQALKEYPDEPSIGMALAITILQNPQRPGKNSAVKELVGLFPNSGEIACFHSLALAFDNNVGAAYQELKRARSLGADPAKVLGPQVVQAIETHGAPGLPERFGWIMLYFAGFYAVVMVVMSLAGLVLAGQTRGSRALGLLDSRPEQLVEEGQVIRVSGETLLARLYALALIVGLVLFYLSIPFIVFGLLGTTALLVYLIFLGGRIPIKLVILIVIFGLAAAWAVLKSLFSKPASGAFGLPKSAAECPRLYQVIDEVAHRVDTDPVHEIYVAPGSEIGVHQEGRGPFGLFGVKSRVLTLGLAAMRFLTVSELKAILAHEYAHFSHSDTFYARFIYQVHISIGQALWGMGQAGGYLNYGNPFYWFLYLYYKSYSLLSAGFSRSREFLADRMASSLYGSDVFADALIKVSTDGARFEKSIWENIPNQLATQKDFANIYESTHESAAGDLTTEKRSAEYEKLLAETGSLFAQHPTIADRLDAVAELPTADKKDSSSALGLFNDSAAMEKELTQFMAQYIYAVQQLQMQAAQGQ
jgi:Zn-dependent protease with chaperone function